MRRRTRSLLLALLSIAPALSACGRRAQVSRYPEAGAGKLAAELAGELMLHSAAQATYCRGDSVLVIVAVTSRWTAGLALRSVFPAETTRTFSVGAALAGAGTATSAFRTVTDSVEPALIATRGTIRLDTGRLATGRFDVSVPAVDARSRPRRVLGVFRALPTADTTSTCSTTPRTP